MRIPRFAFKTLTLLAFATLSTLAAADDDAPGQVGRIALTQGQVSIGGDVGAEMSPAQVNWPVTSGNTVSTAAGARTELRIGSTSIRLDGDSSLEVTQLDDANLRLRLHYGSASVRVLDPAVLAGFELETPQARVRLQQGARVRVDAERVRDTSAVEVFEGVALVDGGGSELTLRAGKGAEIGDDDVRTLLARRDEFDDWSAARDRIADTAQAARYVSPDMTGYEDLDRYGSWQTSTDYGPLWTPVVGADWVPYRDGSWVWLDPWGWTWVDNAPWGYAPFHYGRWVYVNRRWSWAPGRHREHPVWAPALVGWVGGSGFNAVFRDRGSRPASGWYPLSPHDRFTPAYRASENHLRWMNGDVRPDPRRGRDFRPQGLTVVPQDRFNGPGRINVARTPVAGAPALAGRDVSASAFAPGVAAPPPPPNRMQRGGGGGDRDRFARAGGRDFERGPERGVERGQDGGGRLDSGRVQRDGFIRQDVPVLTAPSVTGQPAAPLGVTSPTPRQPPGALGITSPTPRQPPGALGITSPTPRPTGPGTISTDPVQPAPIPGGGWVRSERREQFDEMREARRARQAPQMAPPAVMAPPAGMAPQQPQSQPLMAAPPAPQPGFEARAERAHRGEWVRPAPSPASPPPMPAASPAAAPAPAPAQGAPRPAGPPPQRAENNHARGEQHGARQQDR